MLVQWNNAWPPDGRQGFLERGDNGLLEKYLDIKVKSVYMFYDFSFYNQPC